jgi:hypothetical protein
MVNEQFWRRFHNLPVEREYFWPFIAVIVESNGIEASVFSLRTPVEVIEVVKVGLVNDGEFALGERDSAEGIAITEKATGEQGKGENTVEPVRNVNC